MARIEYIPKFTVSGKAMQLIVEIAAALERYKIVISMLLTLNGIEKVRGSTPLISTIKKAA